MLVSGDFGGYQVPDIHQLDTLTGEVSSRNYTRSEASQREEEISTVREIDSVLVEMDPVVISALNKLKSLGLTENEARAIAGI